MVLKVGRDWKRKGRKIFWAQRLYGLRRAGKNRYVCWIGLTASSDSKARYGTQLAVAKRAFLKNWIALSQIQFHQAEELDFPWRMLIRHINYCKEMELYFPILRFNPNLTNFYIKMKLKLKLKINFVE